VAPETLQVLQEMGVNIQGLHSKGLNRLNLEGFKTIINLTDYDLQRFIPENLKGRLIGRPVIDPYGLDLAAYRRCRQEIVLLLENLII
jgi:protein-tyrosine-phosphatase